MILGPVGESRRCGGKPEPGEVYRNATADVPQAFDEPAVEDTPGGVAVQQENDRSRTFVNLMQSCLPNGGEAALERAGAFLLAEPTLGIRQYCFLHMARTRVIFGR